MNKIIHRGCVKCMSTQGCKCLPINGYTEIEVWKTGLFDSGKSLRVRTKKQLLENGIEIPSGIEVWLPNQNISLVSSTLKVSMPNNKVNEIIRTVNIDKLKNR